MNSPSSVQEFPQLSCNHEVGAIKKQRIRTLHFLRRAADTEVDAVVNYEFHYMYYIGKCDAMIRSAKNGLQNLSTGNATLFDAAMNQKERNAFQNDITTSVNESLGEHQESMMGRINATRGQFSQDEESVQKIIRTNRSRDQRSRNKTLANSQCCGYQNSESSQSLLC